MLFIQLCLMVGSLEALFILHDWLATPPDSSWDTSNRLTEPANVQSSFISWVHDAHKTFLEAISAVVIVVIVLGLWSCHITPTRLDIIILNMLDIQSESNSP